MDPAQALADARYILEEDIEVAVELAAKRYELLAPALAIHSNAP